MRFTTLLAVLILAVACSQPGADGAIPEDLAAKKTLLREKQAALKTLNDEIAALEAAIEQQDPNAQKKGVVVTASMLQKQTFQQFTTLQGAVAADGLLSATSEIPARIMQMNLNEGDVVSRGQLVAVLDISQLEKQKEELLTSLDLANTVYERQARLWEQKIGSEFQYLEAKNTKERIEKSLATLETQLSKNRVYAPAGGVVERVALRAGELASPGMPIVQILNTAKLKVSVDVPENYINAIKLGDVVSIRIPALEMEQPARISLLGRTVDPANRTFKAEVNLPQDSRLKPNLLAELQLLEFEQKDAVVIPLDRIQQEVSGKRYVYIVEQNADGLNIARKVYVEIGRSFEGNVIVTSGLTGNENLVMSGARTLTDGQLIDITPVNIEK